MLSIVIPTLNAADTIRETLESLRESPFHWSVVVSDGGSEDDTVAIARAAGAKVVTADRGRGQQLIAGAAAASEEWLLFLHADTRLAPGWSTKVKRYANSPLNRHRAAAFQFSLDDDSQAAQMMETLVKWRCWMFGLPYGDQGLLMARTFYESVGGYRPLAIMEDVDIVRRIHRGRLVFLDVAAVTSARRYREGGYVLRPLRNILCLVLYYLGVPVSVITRVYA
ncbi:MAG: TIGR04283 family arsenosugar biosynthesis glycosyltransferase [Rhodospirillales bacterium]|jgi:rSAM/selenodomain-associated transferase 2